MYRYVIGRVTSKQNSVHYSVSKLEGPMTNLSPYTHRKIQKVTRQHKNATKNFDYKMIADRLTIVSWGNDIHPTSVGEEQSHREHVNLKQQLYLWFMGLLSCQQRFYFEYSGSAFTIIWKWTVFGLQRDNMLYQSMLAVHRLGFS